MKTAFALILFTTTLFSFSCSSGTSSEEIKSHFQGKIEFSINYDLPEDMESQRSLLANKMVTYIGDGFTRVEQQSQMGEQVSIYEVASKKTIILMDLMGQKIALVTTDEDDSQKYKISEEEETKTIAGYKCKSAIFTAETQGHETDFLIFYTEKIPSSYNSQFPGIKGYPLEYSMEVQGMNVTYTASNINEEKVNTSLGEIPEGYKTMAMEEFKAAMGM